MITLRIEVPYASFRKSFARSFAETYALAPPTTVYGMLLSLVGEYFRATHTGVRLAFAYKKLPHIATTLRKLSRYKYGVPAKQATLGNAPDFIETLCELDFLCWIDSSEENTRLIAAETLELRLQNALNSPENVNRRGVLYLGLSDDAVNSVNICNTFEGDWYRLLPDDAGPIELPVWVDHVGAANTRWQRFKFDESPGPLNDVPGSANWRWVRMIDPTVQ